MTLVSLNPAIPSDDISAQTETVEFLSFPVEWLPTSKKHIMGQFVVFKLS